MIDYTCPKCDEPMASPDSLAGRSETCPACGNVAHIPAAPSGPPPLPPRASRRTPNPAGTSPVSPLEGNVRGMARWKWIPIVGVIIALLIIFAVLTAPEDSSEAREAAARAELYGTKTMAWVMAQDFVTNRLVSPATADFGGIFEQSSKDCVIDLGQGRYRARGWVDSQNSFGALVRTHFTCTLRYVGNDQWKCESLDITGRTG